MKLIYWNTYDVLHLNDFLKTYEIGMNMKELIQMNYLFHEIKINKNLLSNGLACLCKIEIHKIH